MFVVIPPLALSNPNKIVLPETTRPPVLVVPETVVLSLTAKLAFISSVPEVNGLLLRGVNGACVCTADVETTTSSVDSISSSKASKLVLVAPNAGLEDQSFLFLLPQKSG